MPYEFKFPDVGEGIHEGEIVKWLVKEGDKIDADQPLGEIETDKAIVEMPSPKAGKIFKIHVQAGGKIHVGETMVTILEGNETEADAKKYMESQKAEEKKESKSDVPYTGSVVGFVEEAKSVSPIYSAKTQKTQQVQSQAQATPAVRNLAKQLNVNLETLKGTGTDGRITIEDVQKAAGISKKEEQGDASELERTRSQATAPAGIKVTRKYDLFGYIDRVPLHGIKKIVAQKMSESIFTAAQLTNMHEFDVTELVNLREKEKAEYEKENVKLTFLPYIVRAAALCLKEHPYLNASLEGEEIILKKYYNIGIAVDTEEGLVVPVVKGAEAKNIKTIAKDIDKLINDARSRKINLMDLKGGTFSISNLGSVSVHYFTPIINYPESAILGVGRIMDKPVVKSGKVVIGKILPLSITYDHRIVDGAQAARFMMDLIVRLELCEFD